MFDEKAERMRCNTCGRFMEYQEPGSSWVFVPGSDISWEEDKDQCKKCTDKYGPLLPSQSVVIHICCGVYTKEVRK